MDLNDDIHQKVNFSELVDKIINDVKIDEDDQSVIFVCKDGTKYIMAHDVNCCEHVYIAEIIGDLNDLINTPIIDVQILKESDKEINNEIIKDLNNQEKDYINGKQWCCNYKHLHIKWTFYKITSNKGDVIFRWCGVTDSCYSIDVGFYEIVDNEVYN